MDKRILAALALVSVSGLMSGAASAETACAGTAGPGTEIAGTNDGTAFVRVTFTPKCSANVHMQYAQDSVVFAVCANSVKGKSTFGGATSGGGVTAATLCTPDTTTGGCTPAGAPELPATGTAATCDGAEVTGTAL